MQAARQAVTQVLRSSQTPALQLASSFDQYLYLLANDADALLAKFAQQTEPPAVEEYEAHLTKCQDAAEAIRLVHRFLSHLISIIVLYVTISKHWRYGVHVLGNDLT